MGIATILALTGNIQTALPGHTRSAFAWLEAICPPIQVLATAYVLKEQLLGAIETRHANEMSYQEALAEWQAATAEPEQHPHWTQCYANALHDALWKANSRRQETVSQMNRDDWRIAVTREMQADQWYEQSEQEETLLAAQSPHGSTLTASKNGNSPKVTAAG